MTALTDAEKDQVFTLAVLAVARRIKTLPETELKDISFTADGVRAEIGNILIEHLSQDQILYLAAGDLAGQVAGCFQQFAEVSLVFTGAVDMDQMISGVEKFCSDKLGREVKI